MYLLCADMVHYSMVKPPTLQEIALSVNNLNLGAKAGLQLLGYFEGTDSDGITPAIVLDAVASFSKDLQLLLASNGLSDIKLTYIDVEHLLCKFSRLWNLRLYRDSPSL